MTEALRTEPSPKRVRTYLGGELVVDTTDALLVWEKPYYPTYFLPVDDVRADALPIGRRRDEVPDHVAFAWGAMDAWFEEDEEVFVHARDPYKRIDALRSSRHVRVEVDGVVLAESDRPTILFETSLPPRYYLPKIDVRMDLLDPTDSATSCPYKGDARYWSARVGDRVVRDVAWSYPTPFPESQPVMGLVCFYNERVDLIVDGEAVPRPHTPFSNDPLA
ncbi:MAG: hypothetical protein QOG87_1876 [Actinomycetota bacterium]|jgi:uncharacterized protein (DUF427 family)